MNTGPRRAADPTDAFDGISHQLCCQHLLRDLQDAAQSYPGAIWPGQIAEALRGLIHHANVARRQGLHAVPAKMTAEHLKLFRRGIAVGLSQVRRVPGAKTRQPPARLLLGRNFGLTMHRYMPLHIALCRVLCILAGQERSMLQCVADVPQWDPDAGGPAYVYMRVADHIAARIAAGDLPAEARLPAERDLAAEYTVAIGTARRAVLELRDRGLVMTLPGKGTYVVSPANQPKI